MSELAICLFPIRPDFVKRFLETLYKHTPHDFRVFLCDQTVDGIDKDLIKKYVHWYIKPYHNLGFSKAANETMYTAHRQGYEYIAACNDDVEYIDSRWFQGIKDQFAEDSRIMVVNPESPRVPLWGYGRDHGEYADILEYKEEYTPADYDYLCAGDYDDLPLRLPNLPATFPLKKRGVIDGFAMWHPVFKREALEKIGYLDEKFMYGGGEDYDYMARGYRQKYRLVASMKSWVWHWWGKSKDEVSSLPKELFDRPFWNNNDELWPPEWNFGQHVDPWGHATHPMTGEKIPFKRVETVHIDPI